MKIKKSKKSDVNENKYDLLELDFDDIYLIREGLKRQKKHREENKERIESIMKTYDLEHNEAHIKMFGSKVKIDKFIQDDIKELERLTLLIETIENRW